MLKDATLFQLAGHGRRLAGHLLQPVHPADLVGDPGLARDKEAGPGYQAHAGHKDVDEVRAQVHQGLPGESEETLQSLGILGRDGPLLELGVHVAGQQA